MKVIAHYRIERADMVTEVEVPDDTKAIAMADAIHHQIKADVLANVDRIIAENVKVQLAFTRKS